MRLAIGACVFALVPAAAFGQVTFVVNVDGNEDEIVLNGGQCDRNLTIHWEAAAPGQVKREELRIWLTKETCGDDPAAGETVFREPDWITKGEGDFTVRVGELTVFTPDAGCGAAVEHTLNVCGSLEYAFDNTQTAQRAEPSTSPTITYDGKPPATPVLSELVALDRAASVTFSTDADARFIVVEARAKGEADFAFRLRANVGNGTVQVQGLENDVTYEVRVHAEDAVGNASAASNVREVTPIHTIGVFEDLRRSGSTEAGGCQTAAGMTALHAVWLLPLLRRRRRR